jgi:hypothetical protein
VASPGGGANALDNPTGPVEEADGRSRRARVPLQDTRPPVELEYRDLIEDAKNSEGHQTSAVVGSAWDRSNRLLVLTCHVLEIIGCRQQSSSLGDEISGISMSLKKANRGCQAGPLGPLPRKL